MTESWRTASAGRGLLRRGLAMDGEECGDRREKWDQGIEEKIEGVIVVTRVYGIGDEGVEGGADAIEADAEG
ncbi:major facilitator superfamily protein [Actinidia rufa]|uniref:Major facilitator superfamily protein n=1 Tax=Actinidia rufa TaxID=165716 RepID=A0A7J0EVK2_9ERIC|nr:major facilitator superfamily protein [Actinidia rufa]